MSDPYRVVLVTAPDEATARAIASALVEERLAACVTIVPGVRSVYRWEGKVCDEGEALMVCKSDAARFEQLRAKVVSLHPFEVPEVIALPIAGGHGPYLAWLGQSLS